MRNNGLEKALKATWKNKEKFYEDTKSLSMLEIIKGIEEKYKVRSVAHKPDFDKSEFYAGAGEKAQGREGGG